ncbi:hypothetical protein ABK040_005915 [Willaertia magna]
MASKVSRKTCAELKGSFATKLVTVHPTTTLDKCLMEMVENDVRHLPVVDDNGKLVGIVSERDIRLVIGSPLIHKDMDIKKEIEEFSKQTASAIMTKSVFTVKGTDPIVEAAKIMRVSRVGALPIVDDQDQVIGILTRTDMLDQLIRLSEDPEETNNQ